MGQKCPYGAYCGGSFYGIVDKLDYIQGMGFDAIWISPVVANTACGYHGYWTQYLHKINEHFGGEKGLKTFVDEAHKRGIAVMFDSVVNHVGPATVAAANANSYEMYEPFNKQ
jgi:alpha-amylase